jgi:hypothetical protein
MQPPLGARVCGMFDGEIDRLMRQQQQQQQICARRE